MDGSYNTTIAKVDVVTTSWSKVGDLSVGRRYHNVILRESAFIVVGGLKRTENETGLPTEECSLVDGVMVCNEVSPTLIGYDYFPELFLVSDVLVTLAA